MPVVHDGFQLLPVGLFTRKRRWTFTNRATRMSIRKQPLQDRRLTSTGAVAGAFSALVFTAVHQVLISSIWNALVAMLVAGAACGASLAWSYALAVGSRTVRSWVLYNTLYVLVLIALGLTSLVIFEPVTTIAELLKSQEPPRALIGQALPITALFTAASAALLSVLYRPGWRGAWAILLTAVVIVLFLGLNISVLGLVSVPKASLYLIGELLALVITLAAVYAGTVVLLTRPSFGEVDAPN